MHRIPDEMLDLVAGGYTRTGDITNSGVGSSGGGGGGLPVVTVHAPPGSEISFSPFPHWHLPGIGGGSESGSAAVSSPASAEAPPPADNGPHHTSPIPALPPKNVNMDKLRNTVLEAGELMKSFDKNKEHSLFVVLDKNGSLRVSEVTHGEETIVRGAMNVLVGDTVVAWLHSHPVLPDNKKTYLPSSPGNTSNPGEADTANARALLSSPYVDPGMQMYIFEVQSGDVFEYPANGPDNPNPGHNISKDF